MVYEVTCNQCGMHYRVTAPGGETRQVACPSCGHKTTVAFPRISNVQRPSRKRSETNKALWAMLIVLIVGLPLGGYAFYAYYQHQEEERLLFVQKQAERKAHADSLSAIRAQQKADEQAAAAQKVKDGRVVAFLTRFYDETYFGGISPDTYRESLTERCYQQLLADGDTATRQLAWHHFYPSIPEADREELFRNFHIQPKSDGWYNVIFRAHGMTQTRQIRVASYQDRWLIDGYK